MRDSVGDVMAATCVRMEGSRLGLLEREFIDRRVRIGSSKTSSGEFTSSFLV